MNGPRRLGARLVAPQEVVADLAAEVIGVAGYGLGTPTSPNLPSEPLDATRWGDFGGSMDEQRLWGLLARAVADGAFPVDGTQGQAVTEGHRAAVAGCLRLDRELVGLAEAFASEAVEFRVLKGVGSALTLYDDPAERLYGDVDVLVAGADFDRAAAVLTALGGARHSPDPQPGYVARFGKSATFDMGGAWEIDLHRTLALGPFGLAAGRHDLLAEPARIVEIGGRPVPVTPPATALIAAAFHTVLPADSRRVVPLRDVAELLRPGRVDPVRCVALAARWQATVVVAAAIEVATAVFDLPVWGPLQPWAASYRPSRLERTWLARHHDDHPAAYLLRTLDEVRALGSPSAGGAYVRAMLRTASADPEPWAHRAGRLAKAVRPGSS